MPHKKHLGIGLVVGGALVAALFLSFIYVVPHGSSADVAPLWLGAIWAMLTMLWESSGWPPDPASWTIFTAEPMPAPRRGARSAARPTRTPIQLNEGWRSFPSPFLHES